MQNFLQLSREFRDPRHNQPTNQHDKDQGVSFFDGVAGDFAAGVFNPPPSLACELGYGVSDHRSKSSSCLGNIMLKHLRPRSLSTSL